ncbi:MAG: lipoprotein insertase outer membrane protein LolB [Pseudomonadota bacterium]
MLPRPLSQRHSHPCRRLIFCIVLPALVLAGCVSRAPAPPPDQSGDFTVIGKLSVRGAGDPVSARFRWDQLGPDFTVELWGPFGQGRRRLAGSDGKIDLLDGQGGILTSGPAAEIMRRNLGFELPLDSLRYWIQGQPDPALPVQSLAADPNRTAAVSFRQSEWLIELLERDPDGRPRRVRASGRGYEVRLALSRWLAVEAV